MPLAAKGKLTVDYAEQGAGPSVVRRFLDGAAS
jgi:hypothetical protein